MTNKLPLNVFEYSHYKPFVKTWVSQQSRGGYLRIAKCLRLHKTTVSQIFSGKKHLSPDQSAELSALLGLTKEESQFFVLLVERDRATNEQLALRCGEVLALLLKTHRKKERSAKSQPGALQIQAIFYSQWVYAAVRVVCSIKPLNEQEITERLGIDPTLARKAIGFLLHAKLLQRNGLGKFSPTQNATYLAPDSPFIHAHRLNWRARALESEKKITPDEIMFSAPLSISEGGYKWLKRELNSLIRQLYEKVESEDPSRAAILNIDLVSM